MPTNKPIPEFLCYKYKGVKRADQIQASAVQFAWKCRKYQNWKAVQNDSGDKELLLKFADALLDGGTLRLSDYGRISGIFFNVQRWRKDKDELAEEPDILPSWTEHDALMHVVAGNPKVVLQKLEKELSGFKHIPLSFLPEFFFAWSLIEMLKAQKASNLPEIDLKPPFDMEIFGERVETFVHLFYTSVGLSIPAVSPSSRLRELLCAAHRDLGFPIPRFDHTFSSADVDQGRPPKMVVVRYGQLGPLQLMKATEVEGHIHLVINEEHSFVRHAAKDANTKESLETFLSAYAEAVQEMPSHKDAFEALTSYLGIILKRRKKP
jgi:hypothetical protein